MCEGVRERETSPDGPGGPAPCRAAPLLVVVGRGQLPAGSFAAARPRLRASLSTCFCIWPSLSWPLNLAARTSLQNRLHPGTHRGGGVLGTSPCGTRSLKVFKRSIILGCLEVGPVHIRSLRAALMPSPHWNGGTPVRPHSRAPESPLPSVWTQVELPPPPAPPRECPRPLLEAHPGWGAGESASSSRT